MPQRVLRWLVGLTACLAAAYAAPAIAEAPHPSTHIERHGLTQGLRTYPYATLLRSVRIWDFNTLERMRLDLNERIEGGRAGDFFIGHLAEHYVASQGFTGARIEDVVALGEAFMRFAATASSGFEGEFNRGDPSGRAAGGGRAGGIYRVIGMHILASAARRLEADIEAKRIDREAETTEALVKRLRRSRIVMTLRKGTLAKLRENLTKCVGGDARACAHLRNRISDAVAETPDRVRRGLKIPPRLETAYAMSRPRVLHTGASGQAVTLHTLTRQGDVEGSVVWLRRPRARAAYIAHGFNTTAASHYQRWRQGRRVVLATSGGFTNDQGLPEGLTAQQGHIVNSVLMPDRDGLVIVDPDGSIRVVNLKTRSAILPGCEQAQNPRGSVIGLMHLIECIERRRATVFQTQLLAFADQVLIDPWLAPTELRERRLLALAQGADGSVHHLLFDLPRRHNLAEIAASIFGVIRAQGLRVQALLNLDVGAFNILEVYGPGGQQLPEPRGPVPLARATNLIVYAVE